MLGTIVICCSPINNVIYIPGPCNPSSQSIPEIGDYTIKKQRRMERFAPVPDSLLARAAAEAGAQVGYGARG